MLRTKLLTTRNIYLLCCILFVYNTYNHAYANIKKAQSDNTLKWLKENISGLNEQNQNLWAKITFDYDTINNICNITLSQTILELDQTPSECYEYEFNLGKLNSIEISKYGFEFKCLTGRCISKTWCVKSKSGNLIASSKTMEVSAIIYGYRTDRYELAKQIAAAFQSPAKLCKIQRENNANIKKIYRSFSQ